MKTLLVLAGFLFLSSAVRGQGKTVAPKKYTVSLDVVPEKRWQEVMLDNKEVVKGVHEVLSTYIPDELMPYVELIATDIDTYLPQPYAEEMRGISQVLNVSLGDIVMANLIYDVSAFCTSIVSQDPNGQIWHSRNLDYDFTDILRNVTVAVDFQAGGQTVYSVITYAGYIGVMTGQRPGAFTITVDERDQGSILWNLIIGIFDKGTVPISFLVRDVLAGEKTFDDAVQHLAYTPTAADAYFIIGGMKPGEGAVVTKGRLAADDIWKLDADNNRWYLVETNYDHWVAPPASDNRRDPAIKAMNTMGRGNITVASLFNVMSTPPVLNKKTTYTVVMSAAKPTLMQSWIRLP